MKLLNKFNKRVDNVNPLCYNNIVRWLTTYKIHKIMESENYAKLNKRTIK